MNIEDGSARCAGRGANRRAPLAPNLVERASGTTLKRETFETSRTLEYFTEKELTAQIGFGPELWPVAILRELVDNALDAAESANVAPEIEITTDNDTLVVMDNGPGIPSKTIQKSLDYLVRVSDKAHYVSPTRGAMGNALKVIWAAPFVSTGRGSVEIESQGKRHLVEVTLDRIAQRPKIAHTPVKTIDARGRDSAGLLKKKKPGDSYRSERTGTKVKVTWPESTGLLRYPGFDFPKPPTATDLVTGFAAFNPHATFILGGQRFPASSKSWDKWKPHQPTSAHWYTEGTLRDLIAAYIARERKSTTERTVRDFVAEFRGLSSTVKRKVVTERWSGQYLHDFVVNGDVDPEFVRELLKRMKAESKPVPARALGKIGEQHLTRWMVRQGVAEDTIRYVHRAGIDGDAMPYVLEIAFGVNDDSDSIRRIVTGLNWSPVIGGDPDPTLRSAIAEARLDADDPVTLVVHIARPRFQFADRGKTRIELSADLKRAIWSAVKAATRSWKREKRQADRDDRVNEQRLQRMRSRQRVSTKDVAFDVMEEAYMKASANGRYYANARQIMYAARPAILRRSDKGTLDSVYFTQKLLKDYIEEYTPDWKVVWDARGHLIEPHTDRIVSLGGADVEAYMRDWHDKIEIRPPRCTPRIDTKGPANRFKNVLFIEKEGFREILQDAGIGERYDIGLESTKGIPIKAACDLNAAYHERGVRVLVLRDFDYAGFKIVRTLRVGTRLAQGSPVTDLGLRLADAEGLQSEPVTYGQGIDPSIYLEEDCGATAEECDFLISNRGKGNPSGWVGQRVEINAMTSDQLIAWLERKFAEHGVEKFVPDRPALEAAYRRALVLTLLDEEIEAAAERIEQEVNAADAAIPRNLAKRIRAALADDPAQSWDEALWQLVAATKPQDET